jgi:hypothetical protein
MISFPMYRFFVIGIVFERIVSELKKYDRK